MTFGAAPFVQPAGGSGRRAIGFPSRSKTRTSEAEGVPFGSRIMIETGRCRRLSANAESALDHPARSEIGAAVGGNGASQPLNVLSASSVTHSSFKLSPARYLIKYLPLGRTA